MSGATFKLDPLSLVTSKNNWVVANGVQFMHMATVNGTEYVRIRNKMYADTKTKTPYEQHHTSTLVCALVLGIAIGKFIF